MVLARRVSRKQIMTIVLIIVLVVVGAVLAFYFVVDFVAPTARIQSEQFIFVNQPVTFDGRESADNLGIVSYEWEFGDGGTGSDRTSVHTYSSVGAYAVTLTVSDRGGNTAKAATTVFVSYHHPLRMRVGSEDFENNTKIPSKFTCDGEDVSPRLLWENVPEGTKSFAIAVIDPDAPGGEFIHWLAYDIPADVRSVDRGVVPQGAKQLTNDADTVGYMGPCPPRPSTHRYIFTLYALDTENMANIEKGNFREVVWVHALDTAVLVGLYQRAAQ